MASRTSDKFNNCSNYYSDSKSDSDDMYMAINSDDEHFKSDDELIEFGDKKISDDSKFDSDSDSDDMYIAINSDDEHFESDDELIEFGDKEISDDSDFDSDSDFTLNSENYYLSLKDEIDNLRNTNGPFTMDTENIIKQEKNKVLFKKNASKKCTKLNDNECYYCFYKSRRFIFNEILKFYKKNNIGIKNNTISTSLYFKSLKENSSIFKTNFCFINKIWDKRYTLENNIKSIRFIIPIALFF